jgi:hypothetical protein
MLIDPVIFKLPVNVCVLANEDPNIEDPVTYKRDAVIALEIAILDLTIKLSAEDAVAANFAHEDESD